KVLWKIGALLEPPDGLLNIVVDAVEANLVIVENDIRGSPVTISRLTHRAHVDEDSRLRFGVRVLMVDLARLEEGIGMILREYNRVMGVPCKANLPLHVGRGGKDLVHLLSVLKVLLEDVLAGGISRRAVNEKKVSFLVLLGQATYEVPELAV